MGVPYYSYTKIDLFGRCPFAFRARYLDKLEPGPKSEPLQIGTLVHTAIQAYLDGLRRDERRTDPPAMEALAEAVFERPGEFRGSFGEPISHSLPQELAAEVYEILTSWAQKRTFDPAAILAVERKLEWEWEGRRWMAIMDLVSRGADGVLEVTDWKSSWKADTQAEAERSLQLRWYAWAAAAAWGEEKVRARVVFVRHGIEREFLCGDREFGLAEAEMLRAVRRLEEAKEFPPTPGSSCAFCEFGARCPGLAKARMTRAGPCASREEAEAAAAEILVLSAALEGRRAALRKWTATNGPARAGDRVFGYRATRSLRVAPKALLEAVGEEAWAVLSADSRRLKKLLRRPEVLALVEEEENTKFADWKAGSEEAADEENEKEED